jgi:hypothetical protein
MPGKELSALALPLEKLGYASLWRSFDQKKESGLTNKIG